MSSSTASMKVGSLVQTYKQDSSNLLCWVILSSNQIIKSFPITLGPGDPKKPIETGKIPVLELKARSQLMAEHARTKNEPSALRARTAVHDVFQGFAANHPDADIERSNAAYKAFIDVLSECFTVMGGREWEEWEELESSSAAGKTSAGEDDVSDWRELANKTGSSSKASGSTSNKGKDKRPQKQPEGAAKKNSGRKKQAPERYRLVSEKPDEEDPSSAEYLMAVYELVCVWIDVRSCVQQLWSDAAYKGLNTAVAGCVSNVGIDMVINAITLRNPDNAQELYGRNRLAKTTFQDLVVFVKDYIRGGGRGIATKRIMKEISGWDPKFTQQSDSCGEDPVAPGIHQHLAVRPDQPVPFRENEFAGVIGSLVEQKTIDLAPARILPNHVFQLQCIVDSWTIARGGMPGSLDAVDGNPNGLWDFSSFLCGVGLAEALDVHFRMITNLWEWMPEPNLAILGGKLFFYAKDGTPPTTRFYEAITSVHGMMEATQRENEQPDSGAREPPVQRCRVAKWNAEVILSTGVLPTASYSGAGWALNPSPRIILEMMRDDLLNDIRGPTDNPCTILRMKWQLPVLALASLATALPVADTSADTSTNEAAEALQVLKTRVTGSDIYNEWVCIQYNGGDGLASLKAIHTRFNRVWDRTKLTLSAAQCAAAVCGGYYFTVCNFSGENRAETSNKRNIAAARGPQDDWDCITTDYFNQYVRYYYGKRSFSNFFAEMTTRYS
ncbi:hypothetical protein B0H63DRAFT_523566 [Podospora didyma]|uniref:DUF6604 domain-containing protein n=1 Tax=Podospora didyma TaxID=330526 RepID=A0AAE0NFX8_9PEZI|nr:hypothetical protein B0H63DRAFT_523566 [Podospora didyma]